MAFISRSLRNLSLVLALAAQSEILGSSSAHAQTFKTLYSFSRGSDGGVSTAALIDVHGTLYGATQAGGTSDNGTVFKIDRKTGVETVLYSFTGGTDGAVPAYALLNVGGTLFGTTAFGGNLACYAPVGCGTVFKINLGTGAFTSLYSFNGGSDGQFPFASLVRDGRALYGTAEEGGGSDCLEGLGCGTVFKIDPVTGVETVLHAFNGSDGSNPFAALIKVDGILYGTTYRGGAGTGCVLDFGCGTVFKINPKKGTLTTLHSFSADGSDGASPNDPLINVGGILYGTANLDGTGGCAGPYGCGTVFAISPVTGDVTALHDFSGGDGSNPTGALLNVNGILYGEADRGGTSDHGTLFEINLGTGDFTVLHSFNGSDGSGPGAALLNVGGRLYGTTAGGGTSNAGTVFKFKP